MLKPKFYKSLILEIKIKGKLGFTKCYNYTCDRVEQKTAQESKHGLCACGLSY
jgi:hypothetical protein